jgi:carbonic anhydrase
MATFKYKSDASNIKFLSFGDIEKNVKNQMEITRASPFLSAVISVHGFIYDIRTGKISEAQ